MHIRAILKFDTFCMFFVNGRLDLARCSSGCTWGLAKKGVNFRFEVCNFAIVDGISFTLRYYTCLHDVRNIYFGSI